MDLSSSPFAPAGIRSGSSGGTAAAATGANATDATAATGEGLQLFGEDGLDFFDFLDVINPLQHIPVISTIYRMATGDEIASLPRLMGGALFGGIPGLAAAAVNVALDSTTGKDLGEHVATALLGDENGDIAPPVMVAALPAADAPWYMSGVVTYSREGEGQTDPIFTADAGTAASDARDSSPVTLASRSRAQVPWYVAGKTGPNTGASGKTAPVVVAKAEITPAPAPSPAPAPQPHAGLGTAPRDAVEVMDLPPATMTSPAPLPAKTPVSASRSSANPVRNQARTSARAQTAPLAATPTMPGQPVAINANLDTFLKTFATNGGNSSAAVTAARAQAAPMPQTMPVQNAATMPQGVNPAVVAAQANGHGVLAAPPAGGVSNTLFRPPSPDQLPPSLNPMGAHKGLVHTPAANYAKAMMVGLDKYQAAVDRGDVGPSRIYISR